MKAISGPMPAGSPRLMAIFGCMWLLCGALLAGIAATLAPDERALQQTLARLRLGDKVAEPDDDSGVELQAASRREPQDGSDEAA